MIAAGRTMHDAIQAGTYYQLSHPTRGTYAPPACETPAEVISCFLSRWKQSGDTYQIERHLPGSQIGCAMLEIVGEVVL